MYSVASTKSKASIDERLERELETNSRNDEGERRRERLHYRKRMRNFLLHLTYNKPWAALSVVYQMSPPGWSFFLNPGMSPRLLRCPPARFLPPARSSPSGWWGWGMWCSLPPASGWRRYTPSTTSPRIPLVGSGLWEYVQLTVVNNNNKKTFSIRSVCCVL